jgi:uncharacterized membrane protein
MRIASLGHAVFAASLIWIGAWGLINGDFGAIWQGVPKALPAREGLAYVCAVVSLGCGAGLLFARTAAPAARLLLVFLLLWLLLFKARNIVLAPAAIVSWEDAAETVAIVAGAWTLYAVLASDQDRRWLGFATADAGLSLARTLYGLAMIVFGLAHFAYLKATASLVPGWLPSHTAWAYATGGAYIAAGVAIVTGVLARLAASLSALQMGLFTLLVWVPVLVAGSKDPSDWSEAVISATLTAAGWVVADSYRRAPWLGRPSPMPARTRAAS